MHEIEYTYLAKHLPENLAICRSEEIINMYLPSSREPLSLRVRKRGDKREITKKEPLDFSDTTYQAENNIPLTEKEYEALMKAPGKILRKIRYYYNHNGKTAEIDVFPDALAGLVLVDVEFASPQERDSFQMPDFCLAEVTNEKFIAGGWPAGKSYNDIADDLRRYKYQKLILL